MTADEMVDRLRTGGVTLMYVGLNEDSTVDVENVLGSGPYPDVRCAVSLTEAFRQMLSL